VYKQNLTYLFFQRHIVAVNGVLAAAAGADAEFVGPALSPSASQVAFGAARDGWAFSLDTFARMYAPKWKKSVEECRELLWGEHYLDPATNQWLTQSLSPRGTKLKSGFVQFILEPIYLIRTLAMDMARRAELQAKLIALGVQVSEKEFKELADNEPDLKKHFAFVMRRWLPAADSLLELVVTRLPSPLEAQRYRVAVLYDGPQDDECARAIAACDPNGPLMMYVSKMVPFQNVFYCFGRVFSGTVRSGVKVRVLGANYLPGVPKIDVYEDKPVKTCVLMMGRYVSPIEECPSGNTIAVTGLDKFIKKGGTLTTSPVAHIIRQMKFAVAPVMQSAIRPKNAADMTNFQEGLRKLILTDGVAQAIHDTET
jgi:elongation factor 2